ncbi:MAG: hypothetical protein KC731_40545, partial [Myxococcales bacterium]|nr:hypothetical protein [Myxococcales bacterium]
MSPVMSDDAPIRSGEGDWEEDATTVMSRNRRAPESEPPAPDHEDYVVEATMRIRPDQVDRRALPFRQGGGPDRRRRRGTAADRRTADPSPAATRDADPVAEQAPFTRSDPPTAEQRGSVWSQPPLAV